jgi:hypothetical protein
MKRIAVPPVFFSRAISKAPEEVGIVCSHRAPEPFGVIQDFLLIRVT